MAHSVSPWIRRLRPLVGRAVAVGRIPAGAAATAHAFWSDCRKKEGRAGGGPDQAVRFAVRRYSPQPAANTAMYWEVETPP